MKLGMTGTRKGMTPAQIEVARTFIREYQPSIITHGAAEGADSDMHTLAHEQDINCRIHPASGVPSNINNLDVWSTDVVFKKAPPLERNKTMVDEVDQMLAFPAGYNEELRSGTWAAIRYCRKVKRPLIIVWPDGTSHVEVA